jgi:SNF2 family DNA or RNA helicase
VIYAANSYDLEHRYQSEDRTHRRGQRNVVTYIDLIARGTVEEKIVKSLRKKLDLAKIITGANYEDWLI